MDFHKLKINNIKKSICFCAFLLLFLSNQIHSNSQVCNTTYSSPSILYPLNNSTINSGYITFRGVGPANSTVFLYESPTTSSDGTIIGNSLVNEYCEWEFRKPISNSDPSVFTAKIINSSNIEVASEKISVTKVKDATETFIKTPKDFHEFITKKFSLSGTSTPNTNIDIFYKLNDEINQISQSNPYQKLNTIISNNEGEWLLNTNSLPNDDYLFIAVANSTNFRSTSNSLAVKFNYNFQLDDFSIKSHLNNSITHRKKALISGTSPNGDVELYVNNILYQTKSITNKQWKFTLDLPLETTYNIYAKINHNSLSRNSNSITLIRNAKPKISETSSPELKGRILKLTGVGRENTILTITKFRQKTLSFSQNLSSSNSFNTEQVIGQALTNDDGYWSLDIPINSSGEHQFRVYENYSKENETSSETYTYNLTIDSVEQNLSIAPNPFNPNKETLKIQYIINEASNIDVEIYNYSGQQIYSTSLIQGSSGTSIGEHTIEWDGKLNGQFIPPGLYIVILNIKANNTILTKRVGVKW